MNFTKFETKFSQSQNFREFNASPFDTASENEQEQNSDNAPVDNKQTDEGSKPDLTANLHIKSWDGTPLQENIIYNLNDMYGLPIARIKENRDAEKRAKASLQTCKVNGMGQPAKLISARVIFEAGFTPEYRNEEGQWVEVPEDKLDQYYGIMDGHGRHAGYLRDLEAAALDDNYEPFKFIFWYQNITTDVFKKQFPSLNFDTVKTKTGELAKYSASMYKNTQTALYTNLLDDKYIVWVATSGEMALKRMEREIPDLILLDYEMPGLDGKETLERIRVDERTKDIPVIFLTGVADKQNIANVLHLNPKGYILKPPSQDKLFEAIEEALK